MQNCARNCVQGSSQS
uniref:Uncharacterized protein n=1 Tax=Anguilla anguilla TaxID=7936 RepID=A0A0E9T1I9_ANGAN